MTQIILFIFVVAVFYWIFRGYSHNQANVYSKNQFKRFVLTKEHLMQSELGLFVALAAKVAKADGRVDELEAELIRNMFNDISSLFPDPEATKQSLKEIFDTEKQRTDNLESIAKSLYTVLRNDSHKRQKMLEFLVNLSFIDGVLSHSEETMLRKIAQILDYSSDHLSDMFNRFGSFHRNSVKESSLTHAYALLDIDSDASNDAVKKAYRSLVREHHPDIIKAQGASDEYLKVATEKVQEINAAYELIKKMRGI